ncbi:MAG: tetratricopeptide repeat protein [Vicinamibacterales bacterium]|jgi:tetratricopeptide (TPR) repeat protein|nr:tetratricopeptide repeat protein [Vicinamibacterales bacterium]MDP7671677.1 tetratricopeptide repeat protein [Vicinamibacterales bacterium]HJO39174.1 tetratricopeptide repeat protein [Vicinamibacterales bacterium]|tara:strand:+ start:753 stop:3332 length:2580 start_codon:yes stop_codon:yes gene_type:complete
MQREFHRGLLVTRALSSAFIVATVVSAIGPGPAGAQAPDGQPAAVSEASERHEFLRAARRALAHGDIAEAEDLANAREVNDAAAAAVRGRIATGRGDFSEAERLLVPAAGADPTGEAALELGLLMVRLGRGEEALTSLAPIIATAARRRVDVELLRVAEAARALGRFRDANTYFRRAASVAAQDPAINTAWGELFLEKYNTQDAVRSFQTALAADSEWAPAHIGLARALASENPPAAAETAGRALEIDESSEAAYLLLAELALDERRYDDAGEMIEQALEINPNSLEARALRGAIAYVEDRLPDFGNEVQGVLALNPTYGKVYRVAGAQAASHYRFDEAVQLVRRSLELSPDSSLAQAELGMHLLRTGDEAGARETLERSFKVDPFSVVTFNLLRMLDAVDEFETIEAGNLVVRLHPDEAPVLGEYVVSLASEALDTLSARYGVEVDGSVLVEVFPRHDDFAVRNVGLPGMIGALGACFGRVVTMDSPRARPPGTFNWQATLWHEMAHVITLQMSRNRVPRWLTEGISVYEEGLAEPAWGRDMELTFAQALEAGETLPLSELNAGFTEPETISLAYYEASLLVEHLADLYGETVLHDLLRGYGDGLDTDAALDRAAGVDFDDLQATFDVALETRFGDLRQALRQPVSGTLPEAGNELEMLSALATTYPGSYAIQVTYGHALYQAGDLDDAVEVLERASVLVPIATGANSPRALLADIAIRQEDRERAMRELAGLLEYDHRDIEVARRLAALAEETGHTGYQRTAYERIIGIDPFDSVPHAALGRLAMGRGEIPTAIREFRAALAAGPVDAVVARCDLAESLLEAGEIDEAKRHALAALELAPSYERGQELLLRTVGEVP